jgi:hypothetical protein
LLPPLSPAAIEDVCKEIDKAINMTVRPTLARAHMHLNDTRDTHADVQSIKAIKASAEYHTQSV